MKNKLVSLIILINLLLIFKAPGQQSSYYDAMFIYKNCFDNSQNLLINKAGLIPVLSKYYQGTTISDSLIRLNPFFNPFVPVGGIQSVGSGLFNDINLSSIGGLNVSKYANAIASLMIDRAKQELDVAFFRRFKKFADENPEFRILFPKSTDVLASLLEYKYPEMLSSLRTAFYDDLNKIPDNLDDVLELPRYGHLLENFPEVRIAIRSLKLVQELESGTSNAADVIKEFSELKDWDDPNSSENFKNASSGIKLAAIFSESLRNNNNDSLWVSPSQIKELLNNEITFKIYLGLIFQMASKITFYDSGPPILFKDLMKNNQTTIEIFRTKVLEFTLLAHKTQIAYSDIDAKISRHQKLSNDDIYNYIAVSTDIVDYAFSLAKVFHASLNYQEYIALARQSNNLYKDIYGKQYNKAVSDALDILTKISEMVKGHNIDQTNYRTEPFYNVSATQDNKNIIDDLMSGKSKDKDIATLEKDLNDSSSVDPILEAVISKKKIDDLLKFVEKVEPYALFMANVVNAENAEDIKSALNDAILPVGSSGIKKFSDFNISVQSYLGAYYRFEALDNKLATSWSDPFGVTAPIGISFNTGLRKGGSLGLFAALFDIGAIVDYQLKNDSAVNSNGQTVAAINKDYKIELGQIISPGLFLQYGFPYNWPLSLGIGGQYGPGLSKIDSSGDPVLNNPQWRLVVNFTVDLPFFTLYNKSKIKK